MTPGWFIALVIMVAFTLLFCVLIAHKVGVF